VINNENASRVFDTKTLAKLYDEGSEGTFKTRTSKLGADQSHGNHNHNHNHYFQVTYNKEDLQVELIAHLQFYTQT
jgi:hypothetical protein